MTNNELNFLKIFHFLNKYKTIDSRLNIWKTFHKRYVYLTCIMLWLVPLTIMLHQSPGSKLLSLINLPTFAKKCYKQLLLMLGMDLQWSVLCMLSDKGLFSMFEGNSGVLIVYCMTFVVILLVQCAIMQASL